MNGNLIKNNGSKFGIGITIITAIIIIALFAIFVDFGEVALQLGMVDWRFLLGASLMLVAGLVSFGIRWRVLLGNGPGFKEI